MKIGTITFHCAYNFGSALQTYALRKYLTNLGHDVHVIDYCSEDFRNYKIFRNNGIKSVISDLLFLNGNLKRRSNFQKFWHEYFNLTDRKYSGENADFQLSEDFKNYDALICGSDQIWNLDCTLGPIAPFFLSFASNETKKIAYAPSLSHAKFDEKNFTLNDREKISKWLNNFDAISVRELSVAKQFQDLTNKPIKETLDPTLLLDLKEYKEIQALNLPKRIRTRGYVFAYTLWPNADMVRYVDQLARKNDLTIIYYSKAPINYQSRSINAWGIGPDAFLTLIDGADCVISNSFHATVFSILYGKPFLTFGTKKSNSRMKTLLANLGLSEKHLLPIAFNNENSIEPFPSPLNQDKLLRLRASSEQFLNKALME